MAQDFTTTGLLASLKRRGMLPSTAETLSTTDFLAIGTEELQTYVLKVLLAVREEYAVATHDLTIVAGTSSYLLPTRAVGAKLRNAALVDSNGGTSPLVRLEPERAFGDTTRGDIAGYYLQGDDIIFSPVPSSSATVRLTYFRRPSALVATSAVGTITVIASSVVTVGSAPATFTSAATYDFVRSKPPFKILAQDQAATVAGSVLTFSVAPPTGLAVGDYVTLAGESCVPQIPVELHPLLSQRIVYKCLEAIGDDKSVLAEQAADKMRVDLLTLITPRVEGAARPIVNQYGPGFRRFRR